MGKNFGGAPSLVFLVALERTRKRSSDVTCLTPWLLDNKHEYYVWNKRQRHSSIVIRKPLTTKLHGFGFYSTSSIGLSLQTEAARRTLVLHT